MHVVNTTTNRQLISWSVAWFWLQFLFSPSSKRFSETHHGKSNSNINGVAVTKLGDIAKRLISGRNIYLNIELA